MSLHSGNIAPDFSAATSTGKIGFHDRIGNDRVFFLGHRGDFTPVCTTEIGRTAQLRTLSRGALSNPWVFRQIRSPSI